MRNPASVVASFAARDNVPVEKAYFLWLQHVLPSLNFVKNTRYVVVDYDELLTKPYAQIVRISSQLGLPLPKRKNALVRNFENKFLENGLRHTVFTEAELASDGRAPRMVAVTYHLLHRLATDQAVLENPSTQKALDSLNDHLKEASPLFTYVNTLEDEQMQTMAQIGHLNDAMVVKDIAVKQQAEEIHRLDNMID